MLETGKGLPGPCNDPARFPGGEFAADNPFTPDILVFDQNGRLIRRGLAKPTPTGGGFQPEGPAIDIEFENGFLGGPLFATDNNGENDSSRIVTVDPTTGTVTPFITGLPTGDHFTEQLAFNGGSLYFTQGSATNTAVVGRDNGGGKNQPDIPCQTITLSQNVFDSGGGVHTSG